MRALFVSTMLTKSRADRSSIVDEDRVIDHNSPPAQILLADQLLLFRLILEIAAMRHGDGQGQRATTPSTNPTPIVSATRRA